MIVIVPFALLSTTAVASAPSTAVEETGDESGQATPRSEPAAEDTDQAPSLDDEAKEEMPESDDESQGTLLDEIEAVLSEEEDGPQAADAEDGEEKEPEHKEKDLNKNEDLALAFPHATATDPQDEVPGRARGQSSRHRGFFFRFAADLGFSRIESDGIFPGIGRDAAVRGTTLGFKLYMGGTIRGKVTIHGTLHLPLTFLSGGLGELENDTPVGLFMGPGITYYWDPPNVYLTGSIGGGTLDVSPEAEEEASFDDSENGLSGTVGIGFELAVGKEWWITRDWGIGICGTIFYSFYTLEHTLDDEGKTRFHQLIVSFGFDSTFN
jgi:hypothetical protein